MKEDKLNRFFFQYGDKELMMDVIEYAGMRWVDQIKASIMEMMDIDHKVDALLYGYTMGTKKYPQLLSTYIDLWKIVKDQQDEYIKLRLKTIYNFYVAEFTHIVRDIGCQQIPYNELVAFGVFITLMSDVAHIQSLILDNQLDFDCMYSILNKLAKQFFNRELVI